MAGSLAGAPVTVVLPQEIDLTNYITAAATLLKALDHPGVIIADMTGTTVCDSSGLRMLLIAHDRAVASGASLRVAVQPGSAVAQALSDYGLDRVLTLSAGTEDAGSGPLG